MQAPPAVDPRLLRQALGSFPTGVAVLTTLGANGAFVGLTVSSFTALSLDPPLILWALSARSASLRAFESSEHFAVNILAEDQVEISRRFASSNPNRFQGIAVHSGLSGTPLIEGCSAHIECRVHSAQPGGDHVLFVGRVERVRVHGRPPLLYVGSRYRRVGADIGASAGDDAGAAPIARDSKQGGQA